MKTEAYTIHHIELSEPFPTQWPAGHYYFVFRYRSIPLGDRYVDQELNHDDFTAMVIHSVWPALKARQRSAPIEKPKSVDQLRAVCADVLAPLHPEQYPSMCDVSVVICTRNRPKHLRSCLQRLTKQVSMPAEIIVVDNASSSDETRQVALEFGVRYVREDRPGLDIARNTGAFYATRPILAYTDDDTIPDSTWVYRVYETFKNSNVAAMTGLVIAASLQTEAEIIFEKYWPFNRGYVTKLYDSNFFSSTLEAGPPVWEIGAGANMAFRKELFEEVGYFDERLDVGAAGCSGDSEQWYRILANGYQIVYNPLAVVQHSHRTSICDLKKQLHDYMRGFTVAIFIQYQRFRHSGNLRHFIKVFPFYYLKLIGKGFPYYRHQYQTVFSEMAGIVSGLFYYWRNRNKRITNSLGWEN